MDVYKANIQYDGSLDKLRLIVVVVGDFHSKEMIGDAWSATLPSINKEYKNWISLMHFYKPM